MTCIFMYNTCVQCVYIHACVLLSIEYSNLYGCVICKINCGLQGSFRTDSTGQTVLDPQCYAVSTRAGIGMEPVKGKGLVPRIVYCHVRFEGFWRDTFC